MKSMIRTLGVAAIAGLIAVPAIASADYDEFQENIYVAPAPVVTAPETVYPDYGAFNQLLNDADLDALADAYNSQFPVTPVDDFVE